MDNFPIIQALCRAAMASSSPAARKQVERLRDALHLQGDSRHAAALTAILSSADRATEMAPSRITPSKAGFAGEVLTPQTPVPVDKESSTPLAEIIFPHRLSDQGPLFDAVVTDAIATLLRDWKNAEALAAVNAPAPRSCLIYGAPGTGKTHLALWIAKSLSLPVVLARLDSLVSSFLGTSSRNIAALFGFANRYQCILLLDEFDAIAKLRDDPHEVGEVKRVVNALMQNLDSRQPVGLTIGITNHPRLLDPAIWRRFEVQLEIPKPSFAIRLQMAQRFMHPVDAPTGHLKLLAWITEGASGAEVEVLVRSYKKEVTVNPDAARQLLTLIRRFITLNTGRISPERKDAVLGDEDKFLQVLRETFSLEELGQLTGHDKSTMSRRFKSNKGFD